MKTIAFSPASIIGAGVLALSVLTLSTAHAAPITVPADNEAGWKSQKEHRGEHKSRSQVANETEQWRATHGSNAGCPGGQVYCGDQHNNMMMGKGSSADKPNGFYTADIYTGGP